MGSHSEPEEESPHAETLRLAGTDPVKVERFLRNTANNVRSLVTIGGDLDAEDMSHVAAVFEVAAETLAQLHSRVEELEAERVHERTRSGFLASECDSLTDRAEAAERERDEYSALLKAAEYERETLSNRPCRFCGL